MLVAQHVEQEERVEAGAAADDHPEGVEDHGPIDGSPAVVGQRVHLDQSPRREGCLLYTSDAADE